MFYGQGEEPQPFLAMELCAGTSLRKTMAALGESFKPRVVIGILRQLLDVLIHAHEHGVVHRDIKDDNVLVSTSAEQLWLIDFGFCRAEDAPKDPKTWDRVGADLYAPPSKLEHPGAVDASHDLFAVGVLGYLLLANRYPWYVEGDWGNLLEAMRDERPVTLTRFGVPLPLSTFIQSLLTTHDTLRPSAKEALASLNSVSNQTTSMEVRNATYHTSRPLCPRVFRDPLYGDIRLTELEWSVLNSPEFQRLGYLRQLGTAHYVYRGATHSRMLHSLGTLHMAETVMRSAEEAHGDQLDEELRLQARLYALVHDVTHIAFGHTLEDEMGLFTRHDQNWSRAARILSMKSQLAQVLRSTSYGRKVLQDLLDPAPTERRNNFVREVVDSPVGADVLDYINRDAYFCGLDENIDSAIFRRFRITHEAPDKVHFVVSLRGKHGHRVDANSSLRTVFEARYSLHEKIYCHRVKYCAGAMLGAAVALARKTLRSGTSATLLESDIEAMGDDELVYRLSVSSRAAVRNLAQRILRRDLYQAAFVGSVIDDIEVQDSAEAQSKLQERLGFSITAPEGREELQNRITKFVKLKDVQIICHVPSNAPGFSRLLRLRYDRGHDVVETDTSVNRLFAQVRKQHLGLWKLSVFCSDSDPALLERVAQAVADVTGIANELPAWGHGGNRLL
jgi:hypothetical protein